MVNRCKDCPLYKDGKCELDNKPYLCTIKNYRGNYISEEYSNITYITPAGVVLKFKSEAKRQSFLRILKYRVDQLKKLDGKIFKFTGEGKSFDLTDLIEKCYLKTYKEVVAHGNKDNKTSA